VKLVGEYGLLGIFGGRRSRRGGTVGGVAGTVDDRQTRVFWKGWIGGREGAAIKDRSTARLNPVGVLAVHAQACVNAVTSGLVPHVGRIAQDSSNMQTIEGRDRGGRRCQSCPAVAANAREMWIGESAARSGGSRATG
jgi:hypothetical protein